MIPLLVTGAVSLASNVVDAWKAHNENMAMSKVVSAPGFQEALKTAASSAASAVQAQQQAALPGELQSVTRQILQSPDVQSIARGTTNSSVNLQFDSQGELYASQSGGSLRHIMVSPEVRAELQHLNDAMKHSAAGSYMGGTKVSGDMPGTSTPVQVSLAAV